MYGLTESYPADEDDEQKRKLPEKKTVVEEPEKVERVEKIAKAELKFATKQEAKACFVEMLREHNIAPGISWDVCMKKIVHDERFGVLKSLGEKKHAFHEYCDKKKKEDKENKRLAAKKSREDFLEMLKETSGLKSTMKFEKSV